MSSDLPLTLVSDSSQHRFHGKIQLRLHLFVSFESIPKAALLDLQQKKHALKLRKQKINPSFLH